MATIAKSFQQRLTITVLLLLLTITCGAAYGQTNKQADGRRYVNVEVDGLACPFCAYGLEKKLKNIKGQENLYIDIQHGYATFNVPADSKITKEKINKIVEEAGFTARKVTFSNKAFDNKKQNEK